MDLQSTFMQGDIICSSFQKTGLHPIDPGIFTKADFEPSNTFSVQSHLPEGYPAVTDKETDEEIRDQEDEIESEIVSTICFLNLALMKTY